MALSLALGLGLQGAPKDYVDVYMARQKGKAAAEQKAAEAKAKKIDPYLQRMYKAMGDTYLPKDENLIFEEQANALKTAEDGDLNVATQAFSRVMANAAKAKSDYNLVTKVEGYRGADGTTEEILNDIKNTPDRAELATKLNSNPLSTFNVGPDGQLVYNGFKRVDVTKDIFQTLNQPAFYDPTLKSQTPIKFGEKNYIAIGLKPEAAQMLTQKFSSPDFKRSVYAEYGEKLKQLNTPPDFTTPAGIATFQKGAEDFLATKVQEQFPLFSKLVPADRRQGSTFNIYTGDQNKPTPFDIGKTTTKVGFANPITGQTEISEVTDYFGFSGGNFKFVGAPSGNAYYNNTGKPVNRADIRNGDYSTFKGRLILTRDIKDKNGDVLYPKGMSVPEDYEKYAIDNGIVKAGIIVEGQVNNESFVVDATGLYPNAFSAVSKDEKPQLEESYKQARTKQDELQGWLDKNSGKNKDPLLWNIGKKPAAATTKLATPKVKTIKSSDIPAKAKASGKSVDEYTKLLKQNGITITN